MGTAITPRCIAVVFATLLTVGIPFSSVAAQGFEGFEGCPGGGVSYPVDYYLPHLWGNYVIVSDERRDAEQLAATFTDPADALSRLAAWCWLGQAERVYFNAQDDRTVDVSVHNFLGPEGATLAQRWFGYQRAHGLGLRGDTQTRAQLEEELEEGELGPVNIEALDNIFINAYSNDNEYTLYARRGDLVVRVTVSGEPSVHGWSREAEAYRVLAQIFDVDLFPPRGP